MRWNWCWNPRYWRLGYREAGGVLGHRVYGYGWCFGPLELQRWYGPIGLDGSLRHRGHAADEPQTGQPNRTPK